MASKSYFALKFILILFCRMQMQAMNQYGNQRGYGGPPQPQRQGGRRGMNRGGFRNPRFDQNQRNQNHGQGGQRPNNDVSQVIYLIVLDRNSDYKVRPIFPRLYMYFYH